jgi:hypothetical protein
MSYTNIIMKGRQMNMLRREKTYIKTAKAVLTGIVLILSFALAATARPQGPDVKEVIYGIRGHSAPSPEVVRILSVLEERVDDGKLIEKAKQKLATMNEKDLRLMASLCDRIWVGGNDAGADFAFLMAAMLVVLS